MSRIVALYSDEYSGDWFAHTSLDSGKNWLTPVPVAFNSAWRNGVWTGQVFCFVGESIILANNYALTTTNGKDFNTPPLPVPPNNDLAWHTVAWNGSVISILTESSSNYGAAASSDQGQTWQQGYIPGHGGTGEAGDPATGLLVTVDSNNILGDTNTSTNGLDWVVHHGALNSQGSWNALSCMNSLFCTTCANGGLTAVTSDGANWTYGLIMEGTGDWAALSNNGTIFCAGGSNGHAAVSANGLDWTVFLNVFFDLYGYNVKWVRMLFDGELFCLFGPHGEIVTSPDGEHWTKQPTKPEVYFTGAVAVDPAFVPPAQFQIDGCVSGSTSEQITLVSARTFVVSDTVSTSTAQNITLTLTGTGGTGGTGIRSPSGRAITIRSGTGRQITTRRYIDGTWI